MNGKYAVAAVAQLTKIVEDEWDESLKRWQPRLRDKQSVRDLHASDTVCVWNSKGQVEEVSIFDLWFKWEKRNTFYHSGVIPTPDKYKPYTRNAVRGEVIQQSKDEYCFYNMWQGFIAEIDAIPDFKLGSVGATGINGDEGDWDSNDPDLYLLPEAERTVNYNRGYTVTQRAFLGCKKIRWHLRYIWAGGFEDTADYVMQWFGDMFQNPDQPGKRVLVLQSAQGAGKNIIVDNVCGKLMGHHCISTAKASDVVGQFNWKLGESVLVYLNEAVYGGDKKVMGQYKSQTTDEILSTERKGLDQQQVKNYTHTIIASNEAWVTGADKDDRRHVYLPVSNEKVKDKQYFKELGMEIKTGGPDSFLHCMQAFRIDRPLAVVPAHESGQRLKDVLQTEEPMLRFMHAVLSDPETFDMPASWYTEGVSLTKEELWEKFQEYCEDSKILRKFISQQEFYSYFKHYGILSDTKKLESFGFIMTRRKKNSRFLELLSLPMCRKKLDRNLQVSSDWGNELTS